MLEYRRVLVDRQPAEVSEPSQRLINTGVASLRLLWRRLFRRGGLRRMFRPGGFRPGRAVPVALHQAALLSANHVPCGHRFSHERYRPETTERVTRRAASCADPTLKGPELQNGLRLGS
jgi:hypothetical protein